MQAGALDGLIEGNDELVGIGAAWLDAGDGRRGIVKDLRRAGEGDSEACTIAGPVIHDEEVGLAGGDIDARHDGRIGGTVLHDVVVGGISV